MGSSRRRFYLFWIGDTINVLGTSITWFLLPLIAIDSLHASTFQVGLITTVRWVPALLVGLPAGAWTERREKRSVLLGCNALSALAMVAIPVLGLVSALSIGELYGVLVVIGALAAVFGAAYTPYFSVVLAPDEYKWGMSRVQAARTAAQFAGSALGGVLGTLFSPTTAILADVASFVISFVCLALLPPSPPATTRVLRTSLLADIREGISWLRSEPYLSRLTAAATLENLLMVSFGSVELLFLLRAVHAPPRTAGYLLAAGGFGSIAGALAVPRMASRRGDGLTLRLGFFVLFPASALLCLTQRGIGYSWFILGETSLALGVPAMNVIIVSFRQARVPDELLARVSSTMAVCAQATMLLGGLLGGALAAFLGARDALWAILPATALPGLLLVGGALSHLRDLPAGASPD